MDGTERPIRRPSGQDAQRPYYSGKKKGHRVIVLSETFSGHIHDKTGATDYGMLTPIPDDVLIHSDLGFLGVPKDRPKGTFSLPEKKPKGRLLPDEANARNREKARRLVLVEHALGGVKRFRAVDTLRNSVKIFADRFMLIACGRWNLRVDMTV
ncbi:transposase IS5 family protein [Candidatus Moduliflexus flocculans]|uniref:Transposase IS5 family protein n=1 Tax=Candidatus Moduliflexus flocculans TaxID=1499966 RepID=A0A0S6VUK0_9BACT|nr:transposase IS5 family protein [Candidatus Moduliflexus flocculans]